MDIRNSVVFITGANRGIGKALVEAALNHGAKKIYAAARKLEDLPNFNDSRVVPIALDITDRAQVKKAAEAASDTQLLINNAGARATAPILEGAMEMLMRDMEVNYFGTLSITRAFVPTIARNGGGAIATISSIAGLASMAAVGGYSASKAALSSAIQGMRVELKDSNIRVHAIFPGPIDTGMARAVHKHRSNVNETAENIIAGIEQGSEDIYPDPVSSEIGTLWAHDPKEVARAFANL
mgnify:CR=1 FL=1